MIMRERVPCNVPLRWLVIIGVLALIALPGWSLGQYTLPVAQEPASTRPKSEPIPPVPALSQPASISPTTPTPLPTAGASTAQGPPSTPPISEPVVSPSALNQGPATSLAEPAPSPTAAPSADHDRRLLELERKLDTLLKEVRALRAGGSAAPVTTSSRAHNALTAQTQPWASQSFWQSKQSRPSTEVVVTLIRATYKLPKEKAEALAAFLRDHVKAQVMETKAEGENLIVTTTPEAQQTIRQFIALLQEKPKPSTPASRAMSG